MGRPVKQAHPLLDWLRDQNCLKSDRELAAKLGTGYQYVSAIRQGANPVGATLILAAHEVFGHPVKVIRERMAA